MHESQFPLLSHMARVVFAVPAAPSQRESSVWLGTLWLIRGPAWRHPRWSSWSPLKTNLRLLWQYGSKIEICFENGVLNFDKNIYTILYQQLPEIYLIWSISQWFFCCCCLGWFTLQKCHISTFWILELLEKGGLYVLLATRPSSKSFRVGYE